MKSKSVASILRHVASKLPSIEADAQAGEGTGVVIEPAEKESKKSRRARQAAQEEEGVPAPVEEVPTGGPNEEERLEKLYEQIGWPLGKKYGHPYDAFKLSLTCVHLRYRDS